MVKKVCMVVPSFSAKGGIASVVSGYRGSALEKAYDIRYIETYSDVSKAKKLWKAVASYFKFIHLLIFWKPDMVHIHSSFGASFYRKLPFIWLSSWFHIPIVNHIHGSAIDELYTNASQRKRKLVVQTFGKCDKIVVLSEEWKHKYESFIEPKKIVVLENYSIPHEIMNRDRPEPSRSILFLGFLSEAKGCFDIPQVVKNVCAVYPNVKFILAGDGSVEDKEKLQELISTYQVKDYIDMPGWVRGEEKDLLLQNADVYFLPSYGEAMPMSILEAMGYGLPVISTKVGGIPQLVIDQVNGFLFSPGDIDGFSQAITLLLSDKKQSLEMGRKSLEIVKNRYSLEEHIKKLGEIYEMVCC